MALPDLDPLLRAWAEGDEAARDEVIRLLYADLRRLARHHLRGEGAGTLQPTDLVHEVFLRIVGRPPAGTTPQFFAHAAEVMRCVLVDRARRRNAQKRGGGMRLEELTAEAARTGDASGELLELDASLTALRERDPRQAQVVELRFFGGLSIEQAAVVLGSSPATVKRDWLVARAWLHDRLRGGGP
jgi:RNA polymerase sigma factor (TIGR02999 family)